MMQGGARTGTGLKGASTPFEVVDQSATPQSGVLGQQGHLKRAVEGMYEGP
jgi:hypothetical protein